MEIIIRVYWVFQQTLINESKNNDAKDIYKYLRGEKLISQEQEHLEKLTNLKTKL